ncbi:MAG: hypothetical protein OHK005_13600 [Candidatus Methylacidiphilales bacterium]
MPDSSVGRARPGTSAEAPLPREVSRTPSPGAKEEILELLKGRNWQRAADLEVGNVILLRRSTDEPAPEDKTVILRWRTPSEYERAHLKNSKGKRLNVRGNFQL